MDTGVRGHLTDQAIDTFQLEDRLEGIREIFVERPAAGDTVQCFAGWSGHDWLSLLSDGFSKWDIVLICST